MEKVLHIIVVAATFREVSTTTKELRHGQNFQAGRA